MSTATGEVVALDWADIDVLVDQLAQRCRVRSERHKLLYVWGVPRGGVPVAMSLAHRLGLVLVLDPKVPPRDRTIVVDDLVDSGRTLQPWRDAGFTVDALIRKPHAPEGLAGGAAEFDRWVRFPWEGNETGPEDAVVRLLEWVGEDPGRGGLIDTPRRVVAALREMTAGMHVDPAVLLARTFDEAAYDEMVVVRGIDFTSMCEHHLLTFTGTATVAYIPDGKRVVGLSKLARLVDCFAMRLQLQERLTIQIADAIEQHLEPRGVGVVLRARHSCMGCRGVRKPGAEMVTSRLTGFFKDDPKARAELMALS